MNIRDLYMLDRTAQWVTELIEACRKGGPLYCVNPDLVTNVIRKAKALHTSLEKLQNAVIPNQKEAIP